MSKAQLPKILFVTSIRLIALDKAMTDLGIDHVYDEHGGGHDFIASKSLQFMAEHLVFDELPIGNEVPDSSGVLLFRTNLQHRGDR